MHPFNSNNLSRNGFGGGLAADGGKIFAPPVSARCWRSTRLRPGAVVENVRHPEPRGADRRGGPRFRRECGKRASVPQRCRWSAALDAEGPSRKRGALDQRKPGGGPATLCLRPIHRAKSPPSISRPASRDGHSLTKAAVNTSATAIGEAARPAVDREAVFAMSRSGQLIATSRDKGQRIWTREIPGNADALGCGRYRLCGGRDRKAYRADPQGRQGALADASAGRWPLERAGARGKPTVACLVERPAGGGGRAYRKCRDADRSWHPRDDYARRGRGQALCLDR